MRVAALYDIHGNLPALEAVLQEIDQLNVDQIVVGGDVIVGPMSRECFDLLLSHPKPRHFIKGNCEVAVLNVASGKPVGKLPEGVIEDIKWTAGQFDQKQLDVMHRWPMTTTLETDGVGKALFCHGTPRDENEVFTRLTPQEHLMSVFENLDANLVVCGHTHMQFDRQVNNLRVVNAGSIGMPFGKPGGYWVLLDSDVQFMKTDYDLRKASDQIVDTQYPHARDFAEKSVMNPPSEAAMLSIFSPGLNQ